MNTNHLALEIGLDYKATRHHLRALEQSNLVTKAGQTHDVMFYLSNYLEANIFALDKVTRKLEQQLNRIVCL